MNKPHRILVNQRGIFNLWWHWTLGFGLCTIPMLITVSIPQIWLPFVGFALYMILHMIIDKNHYNASNPGCSMILTICARTLFWSSIVMVIINSLHTSWLEPMLLNPAKFNHNIRFLAVLISAPVTFIITLICKITGRNNEQCRICQFKQGTECNRGFLGHLFAMEANRQINAMLSLSALLTALTYAYYFTFYINTNINTPDELVFIWIPGILYIMSVILFGMRYLGIYQYYRKEVAHQADTHADSTLLRIMILCEDFVYLSSDSEKQLDTPAEFYIPHRDRMDPSEVKTILQKRTNCNDCHVRFLYNSPGFNSDCNVLHFVSFISDAEVFDGNSGLNGQWYTLHQIVKEQKAGHVAAALTQEINRIHRVVMAWKSYDRNGHRLYPIKNYTPIFNLRDFPKWDVDLDDPVWIAVSTNNEDKPLFHLRNLWRKYVAGGGKVEKD